MVTPATIPTREQYPAQAWIKYTSHDALRGWVRVWVVAQPGHPPHEVTLTDTNPDLAAWCTCQSYAYRRHCRHARIAELASHFERIYQVLGDSAASQTLDDAYKVAKSQGVYSPRETAIRVVAKRIGHPAAPRLPAPA